MAVDPSNRLVAGTLEADWNEKLRIWTEAQDCYHRESEAARAGITQAQRKRILTLATDFPRLWGDPATPVKEKKRMIRMLIEDVTLTKREVIEVSIRFRGGATRSFTVPRPPNGWQARLTSPEVVKEIDKLLEEFTLEETAMELNRRGFHPGQRASFNRFTIRNIRNHYGLKGRRERLLAKGLITAEELARRYGVQPDTVKGWYRQGKVKGTRVNDLGVCLFEPTIPFLDAKMSRRYANGIVEA